MSVRRRVAPICLAAGILVSPGLCRSQQVIDLTLESIVDITMDNSYRVRQLRMGIEQSRAYLRSREAGLKSRVYMNLRSPEINSTADYKWNSTLQRDEIVRVDTRRWQMDLSIRQPVILFGHPTNGYLSLNNRMYQYLQGDGQNEVDYYNRYFIRFEQPLFAPNELKNDLEGAKLSLHQEELSFVEDVASLIEDAADDYYNAFRLANRLRIHREHVEMLTGLSDMVQVVTTIDSPETMQIQVEIANSRELLSESQVFLRRHLTGIKHRLRLEAADSLVVREGMEKIVPFAIDREQAMSYGLKYQPGLRRRQIDRRRVEINLEETKAANSFSLDLEMTYGLEKQDEQYQNLWDEQDNSYSVAVNAYIPIWDWGQRNERIKAEKINIDRTDLSIEEIRTSIVTDIDNAITNVQEYQSRALAMDENLAVSQRLFDLSRTRFTTGEISVTDLLTILNGLRDSKLNQLDIYLGYRQSLLDLTMETYYDIESDQPLIDRILEYEHLPELSLTQTE